MRASLLLLTLGLMSATACASAPGPASSFDVVMRVQPEDRVSDTAALTLLDDGTWRLQSDTGEVWRWDLAKGDVVEYRSESSTHIFAVLQTERKALRLQRLDSWPMRPRGAGKLARLRAGEQTCVGEGSWSDARCTHENGQRWSVYELASTDDTTRMAPATDKELSLPYRRAAMMQAHAQGPVFEGSLPEGRWLAIASQPRRGRFAAAPRVGLSQRCDLNSPDLHTAARFVSVEAWPAELSEHPVAIEARAIASGTDALIRCPAGASPLVEMPSIARPLMTSFDDRLLGPAGFAMQPRAVSEASARAWSLSAAFGAVGDWELAAFWAERALAESPPGSDLESLALSVMDLLATGGATDAALRVAYHATRDVWNRDNIPAQLDGAAVLHAQLGQVDAYLKRIQRQQDLAARHRDDRRLAWYRWSELRTRHAARQSSEGSAYREDIVGFEKTHQPDWALAIWAMLGMHDESLPAVQGPEELQNRFQDAGALELWQAVFEPNSLQRCTSDDVLRDCTATSYGLRPRADGEPALMDTLAGVPVISLRKAYPLPHFQNTANTLENPAARANYWIALLPLVHDADAPAALRETLSAMSEVYADKTSICEFRHAFAAHFAHAANRGDRPFLGRARRQWVEFVNWWAAQGVDALCESPSALINALNMRQQDANSWTRQALPLLEERLLRASEESVPVAEVADAASLASTLGDKDHCTRWHLALTLAASQRGHVQLAQNHLIQATGCASQSVELRAHRDLLAAYLEFESSAGRRGFGPSTAGAELRAMTRKNLPASGCVGLVPLNFDLEHHLPDTLRTLASRIALNNLRDQPLGVVTASHLLAQSRAGVRAGLRALATGDVRSAARALHAARSGFASLDHRPGLALTDFIDQTVFGDHMQALADAPADAWQTIELPQTGVPLRSGQATAWLEGLSPRHPEYGSPLHVATLLTLGLNDEAARLVAGREQTLPRLCVSLSSER
ncbi:hypothetical protein DL240_05465 [Lujinxingia litoralis]|uniref:Uncharacterized protein n=2 Tax=Lujinxingia litoralis TaxID=2211119 RepID=A0A328CAW8_9DELT|nr:hypothetical protein DL240_05465 [Lujinxingia litoralis]